MEILHRNLEETVIKFSSDEVLVIHCALYEYKAWVKAFKDTNKATKRRRLALVNKMITLVDLLM